MYFGNTHNNISGEQVLEVDKSDYIVYVKLLFAHHLTHLYLGTDHSVNEVNNVFGDGFLQSNKKVNGIRVDFDSFEKTNGGFNGFLGTYT
jgi:hypothetical protein